MTQILDGISVFQWVSINPDTRMKIASMLDLTKSSHVEVANGHLITDGYTLQDLAGITNAKMERFTHIGDGPQINNLNKLIEIIEVREPVEIKMPVMEVIKEPVKEPVKESIKKKVKKEFKKLKVTKKSKSK